MGQGSNAPDSAGLKARSRGSGWPADFTEGYWSVRRTWRRVSSRFAGVPGRAREGDR